MTGEIDPHRTLLSRAVRRVLLGLYACWGSAIPAMKLMVDTVPRRAHPIRRRVPQADRLRDGSLAGS